MLNVSHAPLVSIDEIKRRLRADVRGFCAHYLPGGYVDQEHWRCSDVHGGQPASTDGDGSFVMDLKGANSGKWHDFSSQEYGDQLDVLTAQLGGLKAAIDEAKRFCGIVEGEPLSPLPPPPKEPKDDDRKNLVEFAGKVYEELAKDLGPGELYLNNRAIWLDPWPNIVRFHKALRFKSAEETEEREVNGRKTQVRVGPKAFVPGLVIAVHDGKDRRFLGVQRVFLNPDAPEQKHPLKGHAKKSLGNVRGGAMWLTPLKPDLLACEGPENGMSIVDMLRDEAVAAIPGASNFAAFGSRLPDQVKRLVIMADFDPEKGQKKVRAGHENAQKLSSLARMNGRAAKVVFPENEGEDWNEILQRLGDDAGAYVRNLIERSPWLPPIRQEGPGEDPADSSNVADLDAARAERDAAEEERREDEERDWFRDIGPPPPGEDNPIWSFQQRYAYVGSFGRFIDRVTLDFMTKEAVTDIWTHMWPKLANALLLDSDTQRVQSLTFWPGKKEFVRDQGRRCINAWRAPAIMPRHGDPRPFIRHIGLLVDDDPQMKQYLLDWLATLVQKPGEKIRNSPLLIGPEGSGKSSITEIMRPVLGEKNVKEIGPHDLETGFNEFFLSAQLVAVEEMKTSNKFELINRLKPLITNNVLRINPKGISAFEIPNRSNMIFYSNDPAAAAISRTDRRFGVHISDADPPDKAYFVEFYNWLRRDGAAVIAHHLRHEHDATEFNPNAHAPHTSSKAIMAGLSSSDVDFRLNEMMDAKQPPFHGDLVHVQDILDVLPKELRPTDKMITRWLRKRRARSLEVRVTVEGTRRIHPWAIHRQSFWATQDAGAVRRQFDQQSKALSRYGVDATDAVSNLDFGEDPLNSV